MMKGNLSLDNKIEMREKSCFVHLSIKLKSRFGLKMKRKKKNSKFREKIHKFILNSVQQLQLFLFRSAGIFDGY